ncbi:SWIM zinc finger domain-containing protein [Chitinophaga sp. CF418]|uniref:SWIM zinc finger family protein n=1 Tax=Chitinophaga sp. CF418 TaxID=1855287 RepID=UPI00091B0327|nr:SWIM zinc finger family protein [Chitinophaga sp. CF418]SHL97583.1 SWIM zinc finger [Chitinophaga sp. CF418]
MLALKKFELQVSDTIVHRGREYYEDGAVLDLEETDKDFWQAEVMGAESYTVEVELFRKDKIKSYSCSCPYDGDICKHVVAVLFLLREELTRLPAIKEAPEKDNFEKLLQKISLEEYQEFILTHAVRDEKFKSTFERHFADKDKSIDIGKKYAYLIRNIIRSNTNGDFIDYRSVHSLANEINKLLEEGDRLIHKANFSNAFILARSVLTEVIDLITYCDDSSGCIGDIISSCIQMIEVIAKSEKVAMDLKEGMFGFVQSVVGNSVYYEYGDFGYEMINVYQTLALQLNKEKSFLNFIDDRIKKASAEKHSYRKDYFLVRKIGFLKAIGNVADAQLLAQQNLDIVEVRKEEVNSSIERKDFLLAKKLIAEGIVIAREKGHEGTVGEWEEELLRIAVLEEDKKTIRHYTKYFAFDGGFDQAYYNQWKKTFTNAEWKDEIEKYIEERIAGIEAQYQKHKGRVWYSPDTQLLDLLAPVYVEEKYWDRLLALMSKEMDLERVLQYHDHLVKEYPLQLLAIYLPAFERKGDVVGNRNEYANLAAKMEMVIETIPEGKEQIIAVAEKIIRKYPRRPAMIEELNTVIKMGKLK